MAVRTVTGLGIGALCLTLCFALVSCSSGRAATTAATAQAPPVTVLTKGAGNGNGDIFLAPQTGGPQGGGQYGSGPEIVSITGQVLWSYRMPAGTFATDLRVPARPRGARP